MAAGLPRVAVVVMGAALIACDAPYEAPCRVRARTEVISDLAIGPVGTSLRRERDRVVASWQRREQVDGGADPTPSLVGFEVAVLDQRGALVRRESVAAPAELRTRKGGVEDLGVVLEDGVRLVHWTQTTSTTDPADGRVRTAATLEAAYVRDGVVTPVPRSPRASCENCKLTTAFVSLGDGSIALVRIVPDIVDAVLGRAPPSPSFVLLRFSRAAEAPVVEETPWLVPAPPRPTPQLGETPIWTPPQQPMSLRVDGSGRIVVIAENRAWLLETSLRPSSGPIDLPSGDAHVAWSAASDATVAWSLDPVTEGRPTSPTREREIFVGVVPKGAAAYASRERVSHSALVSAMDASDDGVGIVFDTLERRSFAAVDARGKKKGGDVPLAERSSGFFLGAEKAVLVPSGEGRYAVVSLGSGALVSTEITCAP